MQPKTGLLCVALLGLALLQVSAHFSKEHDYEKDEQDRFTNCKMLVDHSDCKCSGEASGEVTVGNSTGTTPSTTTGSTGSTGTGSTASVGSTTSSPSNVTFPSIGSGIWEEGELCYLLEVFKNNTINLDSGAQSSFTEWINITQTEIVQNGNMTEYEMIVEIWYSLKGFFADFPETEDVVRFWYIDNWGVGGYGCDLEGLVIDIQSSTTNVTKEKMITVNGNHSQLTDALETCKANVSSSSDQAAIEQLIGDLDSISKEKLSSAEKFVKHYSKFKEFNSAHGNLTKVIFGCRVQGFGLIESYFDISATYWRIDNFKMAAGGSNETDSPLLAALDDLWKNTSFSISERSDFQELHDKYKAYMEIETDVELRLTNFTNQLYELLILAEWDIKPIYSVQIKEYNCSIYELIQAFIYCTDNSIGNGEFTTEATTTTKATTTTATSTSTSSSTSTSTPTTTKASTTTPTTTTAKPSGNCSTVYNVNVFNVPTTNITLMLKGIDDDQANNPQWTNSGTNYITQFAGYKKRIFNIASNSSYNGNDRQKFVDIKTVLTGFTTNNTFKNLVWAVFIQTWGTIGEYCGCP